MRTLICPISTQRISRHVVRLTGLMMATMIALYLLTGNIAFIMAIVVDYFIRAFTTLPYSPFSWVAMQITRQANWPPKQIDKAPKIFAARVGWLFAVGTAVLYFIAPPASLIVGATLMAFALLESVFDFCVGCVVYTYIVLPLVGEA
ncbi:DUF4395 domain-containing protein [Candidatus Leptofilum sp.]|uniref:DUF4395 domain-containing protein n=1 Tax=Candidatus Leptofilum sp. TaxID=3241576 RepID=UPI003B5C0087